MSLLRKHICAFLMTWQFLTWLPTPSGFYESNCKSLMSLYFPIIGALIGCIIALSLYISNIFFPWMVAVAISILIQGLITGAFHEDGLADVADGMGGYEKDKILEIMHDSRIGTYGTYALLSIFLLRFSALYSVESSQAMINVIGYGAAGRLSGVILLTTTKTPQENSQLGSTVSFYGQWHRLLFAAMFTILLFYFIEVSYYFITFAITLILPLILRFYFLKRISGVTGDCAGATCVLSETLLHVIATAKIE